MKKKNNRGSILQIQEGNLINRIDRAFSEVMENVNDMAYPHNKPRKVIITLEVKPTEDRKTVHLKADIKKVLPAKETLVTDLFNYQVRDAVGNTVSMLEEKMGAPRGQIDINGNEINPAMIAYRVDEKKSVVEAKTEKPEIVVPLPEVKEEYEQVDEEIYDGNIIKF